MEQNSTSQNDEGHVYITDSGYVFTTGNDHGTPISLNDYCDQTNSTTTTNSIDNE